MQAMKGKTVPMMQGAKLMVWEQHLTEPLTLNYPVPEGRRYCNFKELIGHRHNSELACFVFLKDNLECLQVVCVYFTIS